MSAYLGVDEYRAAPTAVDSTNLSYGGDSTAQRAALAQAIRAASGWMDNACDQPLGAMQTTETGRFRIGRDGTLKIKPRRSTLLEPPAAGALLSFAYGGPRVDQLFTVTDLAGVFIEGNEFIVPFGATALPSLNLTSPYGYELSAGAVLVCRYTVRTGFPVAALTSDAAAGQAVLHLDDVSGLAAGQVLRTRDVSSETLTVQSVNTGALTATCTTNLTSLHSSGVLVDDLPDELKSAAVWVTSAMIKAKGNQAMVANQLLQPGPQVGQDPVGSADLRLAREVLMSYRLAR